MDNNIAVLDFISVSPLAGNLMCHTSGAFALMAEIVENFSASHLRVFLFLVEKSQPHKPRNALKTKPPLFQQRNFN